MCPHNHAYALRKWTPPAVHATLLQRCTAVDISPRLLAWVGAKLPAPFLLLCADYTLAPSFMGLLMDGQLRAQSGMESRCVAFSVDRFAACATDISLSEACCTQACYDALKGALDSADVSLGACVSGWKCVCVCVPEREGGGGGGESVCVTCPQ